MSYNNNSVNIHMEFGGSDPGIDMAAFSQPTMSSLPAYPTSFGGSDSLNTSGGDPMQNLQNELNSVMSQMNKLSQELEQMEQSIGSGNGGSGGGNGETKYASASGSSTGDPHLSFDGKHHGADNSAKWNDMGSHQDLVDANSSFDGGYQVSTTATALNSSDVAYNKSATISTGDDRDTVTMGQNGDVMVLQDGQDMNLQKGGSVTLNSGAVVSEAQDGSVTVSDANGNGGNISTTMKWNGQGVDVNFNSNHTYLGGDLVDRNPGVMA